MAAASAGKVPNGKVRSPSNAPGARHDAMFASAALVSAADWIVADDAARVLTDGLALVHEREHPGGADQVIERRPHVPLRARGRQCELPGVDVGDDLRRMFVGIVQ